MCAPRWRLLLVCAFALAMTSSCFPPTEIVLELSTDLACSVYAVNGVAIAVGAPGDDQSGIVTVTTLCGGDGGIGSLVVLPSHTSDDSVGIRVTLGVEAGADKCLPPKFDGCIVARRSLRYDPHTPLHLPIDLDQNCLGVFCDPTSTCFNGGCVDASVSCSGTDCNVASDAGGLVDAALSCTPHPAVPIMSTSVGPLAPRIAVTSTGWVVAWSTSANGVSASALTDGPALAVGAPITLVTGTSGVYALGALGSDGVSYGFTYQNSSGTVGILMASDGTPLGSPFKATAGVPGVSGIYYLPPGVYGTGLIEQGVPNLVTFSVSAPFAGDAGIPQTATSHLSLASGASPGAYVASFADNALQCWTYSCVYASGAFTCSSTTKYPGNTCQAIRQAYRGTTEAYAQDLSGNLFAGGTQDLGPVDRPDGFTVIATSVHFHLLWIANGTLYDALYDGGTASKATAIGPALGFDAVADGPNEPGFAVTYVAGTGASAAVYFAHFCQ